MKTMRGLPRLTGALLGLTLLGVVGSANAALIKKYTYQGVNFTTVSGVLSTSDSLSGFFIMDCGLAGGTEDCSSLAFSDYTAEITSFAFSAGSFMLDSSAPGVISFFFATDSSMQLTDYNISIDTSAIVTIDSDTEFPESSDKFETAGGVALGESFTKGTWSVDTLSIPEPATFALFAIGLAGLSFFGWRRRSA